MNSLREVLNAKELINTKKLIIVDGGIGSGSNFCWDIYASCRYYQLDSNNIIEATSKIKELEEIFLCENSYTIKQVTQEIKEFERILGDKITNLTPGGESRSSKTRAKRRYKEQRGKQALLDLQEKAYSVRRLAQSSEINKFPEFKGINNSQFNYLLDIVKLVAKKACLKIDYSFLRGRHETDNSQKSDTDERIATTIYHLCLAGKNPCLLTQDSDLLRLLGIGTKLICSDSFVPYNKELRDKLIQNPYEVYFRDVRNLKGENYQLKLKSSNIRYDNEFKITKISYDKRVGVESRVRYLWNQFREVGVVKGEVGVLRD